MKIRFPAMLVAALALPAAAPAQALDCAPREDVKKVLLFALPYLAEAARTRCSASLPASAFLNSAGLDTYVERLKSGSGDAGPSILRVAKALSADPPEGISAETAQSLARDMLTSKVASEIKPRSCAPIDALLTNFAKMPDDALADTVAIILQLVDASDKKGSIKFNMCPAVPE